MTYGLKQIYIYIYIYIYIEREREREREREKIRAIELTRKLATLAIKDRFQQKGFQMLHKLETILVEKQPISSTIQEVVEFYETDLHLDRFKAQLIALHANESIGDLQIIISFLKGLNDIEKEYYSEVIKVAKLILVMPATNALSEGSFNALRI